jgi:hypothetical protein
MTVLCDGYIYADIFASGDVDGSGRYRARCEEIRNAYGLINDVTLFDMREVLFDMPEWRQTESHIRGSIELLLQQDEAIQQRINVLMDRMRYHVAIPNLSYEDARELYTQETLPDEISGILEESAIRYTSLLLTLRETDLVSRAFPSAIRCTVHPKNAAQIPLHLTNRNNQLLPYNGVATVSRSALERGQTLFNALRTRRLCDVLEYDDPVEVHTEESEYPYYYEVD